MTASLFKLPQDIHLSIFRAMHDVADAQFFSMTSKYFHSLFRNHRRTILRTIILTSDVYEYELMLSKFLVENCRITAILSAKENNRGNIERDQRPTEAEWNACLEANMNNYSVTDDIVEDICHRYWNACLLAKLYKNLFAEYTLFRRKFNLAKTRDEAASCMAPGFLSYESVLSSNETHSFDLKFRARFCKAVCLQAITVVALFQARASIFSSEDIGLSTWDKANCIWLKQFEAVCEWASPLSFKQKLECFEVYDFLYLFLIGKIIPPKALDLWWKDTRAFWTEGDSPSEPVLNQWNRVMQHFRRSLKPWEILDLLSGRAWDADAAYPIDKTLYMRVHGLLMVDGELRYDWWTGFERQDLSHNLDPNSSQPFHDGYWKTWWDYSRIEFGTPFSNIFNWQIPEKK